MNKTYLAFWISIMWSVTLTAHSILPKFPGGEDKLLAFINTNLVFPDEEATQGTSGEVVVSFLVTASGKIDSLMLEREATPNFNAEALRVVNLLPDFIPANVDGVPVAAWYRMPILFRSTKSRITKIDPVVTNNYVEDTLTQKQESTVPIGYQYPDRYNCIKIDLESPSSGRLLFLYERKIANHFSIEFGIGPTFRNLMYEFYHDLFFTNEFNDALSKLSPWKGQAGTYDVIDNHFNYNYRKCKSGVAVSIMPKFYVWGVGLGGLYLAPKFEYSLTNYTYATFNTERMRNNAAKKTETVQLLKPTFGIGYQYVYKRLSAEAVIHGGVCFEYSNREDLGIDLATDTYINGQQSVNYIMPELTLGLRIGYMFGVAKSNVTLFNKKKEIF